MPKAIRITAVLLLAIAVLLAVVAFGLLRRSHGNAPVSTAAAQATAAPRHDVVVAARPLVAGTPLSANDLAVASVAGDAQPGTFDAIDAASGGVLLQSVDSGQPIPRGSVSRGIALALNPGERAVAVPVDELASAGNRVAPGDHVDVFMSLPGVAETTGARQGGMQARLLLSRLRVLGYGDRDMLAAPSSEAEAAPERQAPAPGSRAASIMGQGRSSSGGSTAAPARTAVLAVPVEMIGRLLLGAQSGKLFLALRNPVDTAVADSNLFVAPAPVLAVRNGLGGLEAQETSRPENQAYAGIDLGGLAGMRNATAATPPAIPRPLRHPLHGGGGGIEIVRGANPAIPLSSQ